MPNASLWLSTYDVRPHCLTRQRKRRSPQNSNQQTKPTLKEFVDRVTNGRYQWYRHLLQLADLLERVCRGEIKRLMVFMPPRAGKSYLTTKIFPAYYLYCYPDRFVGLSSYAADLSVTYSKASRFAYLEWGGILKGDSSRFDHWETIQNGGLWACGIGGPATGKGFSLGILDDPEKNSQEASSKTYQAQKRDWWESTWTTRAEPDGALVVVQTRWNDGDLSGWLLDREKEDPEGWHICSMAAIAPDIPTVYPESCTIEPDWRSPGEALCPERFDLKKLQKIKRRVGSYFWASMYQQSPAPLEGAIVKRDWIRWAVPPEDGELVLSWDTAGSAKDTACPWVCTVWRINDGNYYLIDVLRRQMDYPTGRRAALAMLGKWSPAVTLIENKATGQSLIQDLRSDPIGAKYSIVPINPEADKVTRFSVQSGAFESGRVFLPPNADWAEEYLREILRFPVSDTADQVDSTSQFLKWASGRVVILPRFGS